MIVEVRDESGVVFADHGDGNVTLRNETLAMVRAVVALRNGDKYVSGVLTAKGVGVSDELAAETAARLDSLANANDLP